MNARLGMNLGALRLRLDNPDVKSINKTQARALIDEVERLRGIVRDIASSGCECAEAASCDLCGKHLSECQGGDLGDT